MEDHIKISLCFKCQRFGHVASKCNSTEACAYCTSSEHNSIDCPHKSDPSKLLCENCIYAKFRVRNHAASDIDCPVYKKKLAEYIDSIEYDEEN